MHIATLSHSLATTLRSATYVQNPTKLANQLKDMEERLLEIAGDQEFLHGTKEPKVVMKKKTKVYLIDPRFLTQIPGSDLQRVIEDETPDLMDIDVTDEPMELD